MTSEQKTVNNGRKREIYRETKIKELEMKVAIKDPGYHRGEVERMVKDAKSKEDRKRGYTPMTFKDFWQKKQQKCGEDEINKDSCDNNRAADIECTEKSCHHDKCDNRWLTKQQLTKCAPFIEGEMGRGLRATELIQGESIIGPYLGKIVTSKGRKNSGYIARVDGESEIDAADMGNLTRFINHSCKPNCRSRRR